MGAHSGSFHQMFRANLFSRSEFTIPSIMPDESHSSNSFMQIHPDRFRHGDFVVSAFELKIFIAKSWYTNGQLNEFRGAYLSTLDIRRNLQRFLESDDQSQSESESTQKYYGDEHERVYLCIYFPTWPPCESFPFVTTKL